MPKTPDVPTQRRASSLKDSLISLDKDILRLLARRTHMRSRLCDAKGRLDPAVEKSLRAAWEYHAGRMSRDTRLTRQLFALLQEVEFVQRPPKGSENGEQGHGTAFSLTPLRKPVDIRMTAPLACRRSRLYLALAAASGTVCTIAPALLGDPQTECVKMFNQAGASLLWDEHNAIHAREANGITLADKVIFVGNNTLNMYLILGQYVGRHSRVKLTGDSDLKLADLSALQYFLPQLGARLTNVVPGSGGLPVRVECSGMLPDVIRIPAYLPADAATGLLMGAPFWERPIAFDFADHAEAQAILEEACPVLHTSHVQIHVQDMFVRVTPSTGGIGGTVRVPLLPPLGMDLTLAAFILALPGVAGGRVRLEGQWPSCAVADTLRAFLESVGLVCTVDAHGVTTQAHESVSAQNIHDIHAVGLPARFAPLAVAFAAVYALNSSAPVSMPALPPPDANDADDADAIAVESFLAYLGFTVHEGCLVRAPAQPERAWTAPNPAWALALALAAYGSRSLKLANPGVMTGLYPAFWRFYNSLPNPERKKLDTTHDTAGTTVAHAPNAGKPVRRRIVTGNTGSVGSGNSTS